MSRSLSLRALYPVLGLLLCACGQPAPTASTDDGVIPQGLLVSTVIQMTDGCGLLRPELQEGKTLRVLIQRSGESVQVSVPLTTLPSLGTTSHQQERFRTDSQTLPINAMDGRCTGQRTRYYEGLDGAPGEYQVIFHNEDSQPQGDCGLVPIPCMTTATLSIPYCTPRRGCMPRGPAPP